MSRYDIPAKQRDTAVVIGWDPSRRTFFMEVGQPRLERGCRGLTIGRSGSPGEIDDVADLRLLLAPYADIPPQVALGLMDDQETGR